MIDCNKETLLLSDDKIFYTIEGEGEFIGQPSVFMRMSMCNLTCSGFASEDSPHGCDSFIVGFMIIMTARIVNPHNPILNFFFITSCVC